MTLLIIYLLIGIPWSVWAWKGGENNEGWFPNPPYWLYLVISPLWLWWLLIIWINRR